MELFKTQKLVKDQIIN